MGKWIDSYDCDNCGACCTCFCVPVCEEDMRAEPAIEAVVRNRTSLPMWDGKIGTGGRRFYQLMNGPESPCPFHTSDGRCAIHATKPLACSSFKPGDRLCQWARGQAGLPPLEPRCVQS